MSIEKLSDYRDRRSVEENTTTPHRRLYWLRIDYYNKEWTAEILRCFWKEAHSFEDENEQMHQQDAGWGDSFGIFTNGEFLTFEGSTLEDAIAKLAMALGL